MAKISLGYMTQRVEIGMKGAKSFKISGGKVLTKFVHPSVFTAQVFARDKRPGKVAKLSQVLANRLNFEGVWLCNYRTNKLRDIDCNHRQEAVVNHLLRHPNDVIEAELHIYKDLTDDQERVKFTNANDTITQTTSDYLQQYEPEINLWYNINLDHKKKLFPVAVSHKNNGKHIALHNLLHPYLTRGDIPYAGGYRGKAIDFIDKLRAWNAPRGKGLNSDGMDVYNMMKAFTKDYSLLFGPYALKNKYWKPVILFPMFRIWHDNLNSTPTKLLKELKKISNPGGRVIVDEWNTMGGTSANCQKVASLLLDHINGARRVGLCLGIRNQDKGTGKETRKYGKFREELI